MLQRGHPRHKGISLGPDVWFELEAEGYRLSPWLMKTSILSHLHYGSLENRGSLQTLRELNQLCLYHQLVKFLVLIKLQNC